MSTHTINPYLIRSWLIFPAIKERFVKKIFTLKGINKPDAVIFDLEDSVENTLGSKNKARNMLLRYLLENKEYKKKIFGEFVVGIRINGYDSIHSKKDIEAIKAINPHFVIIPKVENQKQIDALKQILPRMILCLIIETLEGYEKRDEILKSLRSYDMIAIGYEDLSSQLGIEKPSNLTLSNPLSHIVNECIISAKKHDVIIKDGPSRKYGSKKNLSEFKKECIHSLQSGFESKVAIHPSQIPIINTIFSKERLRKKAEEIILQFGSLRDGTCVIAENEEMMDKPSMTLYLKALKNLHQQ